MNTPKPFLYEVAKTIYDRHQDELEKVLIVVPSTRAGRFIFNYLKTFLNGESSWLPECLGINSLVEKLANNKSIDRLELSLRLFKLHQKFNPEDTLEGFLKWGGTALTDFNEIENYLLDGARVFSDLRDIKEIEDWSFNEEDLSKNQTQFLEFWNYLGDLKLAFDEELRSEKLGYSGLIIRDAINRLEQGDTSPYWSKIYFVGLNAISNSERKLISILMKDNLAEVISDADAYYHLNSIHEAGHFMRKQEKFFDIEHKLSEGFKDSKEVNFIRANTTLGMSSLAASLVSSDSRNTALILGDEKLLVPLLSSLPEDVKEANITMGYPLSDGMVWRGIHKLLQIKVSFVKIDRAYTDAIVRLLEDPFLTSLFNSSSNFLLRVQQLRLKNKVRISESEANLLCEEELIFRSIFSASSAEVLLTQLGELLELANEKSENKSQFIQEQIAIAHKFLQRLKLKLIEVKELNSILNLSYFIDQMVNVEKVPFLGEPYGGIQIMGLLEARALDFEHVIFCGATDALMPAISSESSFMPFELKVLYGLPTNREKEAVFAYSFYRLCQRAKKIDFIYVETEEGLTANEKSRFLNQLEVELPRYSGSKINYVNAESETTSPSLNILEIPKTAEHKERIKSLLSNGISASAINTFLSCPADFYYKYVIGLREPEKQGEVVHPSITGSILHDTLEKLYQPYIKHVLSQKIIKNIRKIAVKTLDNQVEEARLTDLMSSGENRLEYLVMRKKLLSFLDWELDEVIKLEKTNQLITLESLEENYKNSISGLELKDGTSVVLSGFVDRIDRVGSRLRIIDYKSGSVTQGDLNLKEEFDFSSGKKGKALQLIIYSLLVAESNSDLLESGFSAGNVSLRNISNGLINLRIGAGRSYEEVKINTPFLSDAKAALNEIFREMMEDTNHFYHNQDADFCDFCLKE